MADGISTPHTPAIYLMLDVTSTPFPRAKSRAQVYQTRSLPHGKNMFAMPVGCESLVVTQLSRIADCRW